MFGIGFVQGGGCIACFRVCCALQSVLQQNCICAAESMDVSFRSVDLQISGEKRKGSQVLVLEAQRA